MRDGESFPRRFIFLSPSNAFEPNIPSMEECSLSVPSHQEEKLLSIYLSIHVRIKMWFQASVDCRTLISSGLKKVILSRVKLGC